MHQHGALWQLEIVRLATSNPFNAHYFELLAYQKPQRILVAEILELMYGVKVGVCQHCGGKLHLVES